MIQYLKLNIVQYLEGHGPKVSKQVKEELDPLLN